MGLFLKCLVKIALKALIGKVNCCLKNTHLFIQTFKDSFYSDLWTTGIDWNCSHNNIWFTIQMYFVSFYSWCQNRTKQHNHTLFYIWLWSAYWIFIQVLYLSTTLANIDSVVLRYRLTWYDFRMTSLFYTRALTWSYNQYSHWLCKNFISLGHSVGHAYWHYSRKAAEGCSVFCFVLFFLKFLMVIKYNSTNNCNAIQMV